MKTLGWLSSLSLLSWLLLAACDGGTRPFGAPDAALAPRTCGDGVLNGHETGLDCGGGGCPTCPAGQPCLSPQDCADGVCVDGRCAPARCGDGVLQDGEACDDPLHPGLCDGVCRRRPCGAFRLHAGPEFAPIRTDLAARRIRGGDVTGDGRFDVVVAADRRLLLMIGEGQRFRPGAALEASIGAFAVGDLDGDGDAEVVVRGGRAPEATWLAVLDLAPEGTWVRRLELPVQPGFDEALVLADLNGDGRLDVARSEANALDGRPVGRVEIHLNTQVPGGPPRLADPIQLELSPITHLTAGDFNGDGTTDLVGLGPHAEGAMVQVVASIDGAWRIEQPIGHPAWDPEFDLQTGDVEGDGDLDLLAGDFMLRNAGDGTFGRATFDDTSPFERSTKTIWWDPDADGDLDVLALGPELAWYRQAPDGTFTADRLMEGVADGLQAVVTDLSGDGTPDVVWLDTLGRLGFVRSTCVICGDGVTTSPETCDDGNQDDADACLSDCRQNQPPSVSGITLRPAHPVPGDHVTCWASHWDHEGRPLQVTTRWTVDGQPFDDGETVIADVPDGAHLGCEIEVSDGYHTVVVDTHVEVSGRCGDGRRAPSEGCDDGNLEPADACSATCLPQPPCAALHLTTDLMPTADPVALALEARPPAPPRLVVAQADGLAFHGWQPETGLTAEGHQPIEGRPAGLAAADLDGDGLQDRLVSLADRDEVAVFFGDPAKPEQRIPVGDTPGRLLAADVTGDGVLDLVVATRGQLEVHRGLGGGDFALGWAWETSGPTSVLIAGHLDGDGIADVIQANGGRQFRWVLGGAGLDAPLRVQALDGFVGAAAVADFDGDAFNDLLVERHDPYRSSLVRGRGNGTFEAEEPGGFLGTAGHLHVVEEAGRHQAMLAYNDQLAFAPEVPRPVDGLPLATWKILPVGALSLAGDLDGDGTAELVIHHPEQGILKAYRRPFAGPFHRPVLSQARPDLRAFLWAELDELGPRLWSVTSDGLTSHLQDVSPSAVDMIRWRNSWEKLVVAHVNGGLTVDATRPRTRVIRRAAGADPRLVTGPNLDGNGQEDLFVAHDDGVTIYASWNRDPTELTGERPTALAVFDHERDGRPDLFWATPTGIIVQRLQPDRTFRAEALIGAPAGITALATVHDGLVALGQGGAALHLHIEGARARVTDLGLRATDLATADLDRDGRLEAWLVTADALVGLCPDESHALAQCHHHPVAPGTRLTITDADGDGDQDVGLLSGVDGLFSLLENRCAP